MLMQVLYIFLMRDGKRHDKIKLKVDKNWVKNKTQ